MGGVKAALYSLILVLGVGAAGEVLAKEGSKSNRGLKAASKKTQRAYGIRPALKLTKLQLPSPRPVTEISRKRFKVTLGSMDQTRSKFLLTRSSKMRAVERSGTYSSAKLRVRYKAPSKKTSYLGSGGYKRQIGLKLRASSGCNLLYLMWQIEPTEKFVVLSKINPGMTRHAQCGNENYTNIATLSVPTALTLSTHKTRKLQGDLSFTRDGIKLHIFVDDKFFKTVPIPRSLLPPAGPVGVRSDNGQFIFRYYRTQVINGPSTRPGR